MNFWDYVNALNQAAARPSVNVPAGPPAGADQRKPSPWQLLIGDLLTLAQDKWAPKGWVPFQFNR